MKTLRILGIAAISVTLSSSFAFAEPMVFDFCGGNNEARIDTMTRNGSAGVEYSSKLSVPYSGSEDPVSVGVRIVNMGPGPLTFLWEPDKGLGAWSVFGKAIKTKYQGVAFEDTAFGEDLDRDAWTKIPLTPAKSVVWFHDRRWGGTLEANWDMTGCVYLSEAHFARGRSGGMAHLDLSFWRGSKLHTLRVNINLQ